MSMLNIEIIIVIIIISMILIMILIINHLREFALWILPSSWLSRVCPGSERMSFTSISRRSAGLDRAPPGKPVPYSFATQNDFLTPQNLAYGYSNLEKKDPYSFASSNPPECLALIEECSFVLKSGVHLSLTIGHRI